MDQDRRKDWRELCKAAASELDPAKLISLVSELTRALDERDKKKRDATSEALEALKDEGLETQSFRGEPAVG
jgi:DNA-binding transcriptional ArsR family regulator